MVEQKPEAQTTQLLQEEVGQVAVSDSPMIQHQSQSATNIIDNELNDLFNQNLQQRLEKPIGASLINSMFGNRMPALGMTIHQQLEAAQKENNDTKFDVKSYFQRAKELLFNSEDPDLVIAQIWDDNLTLGVCAKTLKAGDVAWKCEDCEKDPTCIICMDCFNNSNHEGHRTWLKTNVGGCCDCGDPEGWDEKGACDKHKGIDSSKDEALNALPGYVREKAPAIFKSLAKILKTSLLGIIENKQDIQVKRVYESIISDFLHESLTLLDSWKQCIFYLSEACIEVFYGKHKVSQSSNHKCCYRYFPDDQFRESFEEQKAQFDSTVSSFDDTQFCTCTVIDLLFMADQVYEKESKLGKRLMNLCIKLFQSYNFKQHLGFGYIANMASFMNHGGNNRGMAGLGVQILTMESVTKRIFSDPNLCKVVPGTLHDFMTKFVELDADRQMYWSCACFRMDLKYIAKPDLMPLLVENTTIVEDLIEAVYSLQFSDVQKNRTEMDQFGDSTTEKLFMFAQSDLEMVSVLESKYLSYIDRNVDVARLMTYFRAKFLEIDEKFRNEYVDDGFFLAPIHRMFTFLLTRVLMKFYAEKVSQDDDGTEPPMKTDFHNFMVENSLMQDADQMQNTIELALITGARQMGFIAEIESGKWVYKGERFKNIASVEHNAYREKYLRMIGLYQVAICASAQKSRCVDILINNFCVDDWLSVYLMSIGHHNGPTKQMFDGLTKFATEKLAHQVQLLFLKLIEIATTEASFLLPSIKKLKTSKKGQQKIESMFSGHLRREMMHVLFSMGANSTIDLIKKNSHQVYLKSDKFTQAIVELSTQQTDASGKKQFRLNQQGKHEAMFDPYYIVRKKEESAQSTAYDQFYKNNPNCNNFVGDYKQNYKYQTSINRECWQAFAQSQLLTEVVSKTVKECIKVWMVVRGQNASEAVNDEEKTFKQELFPMQTMYMGLKLLIIICQNCQEETIDFISDVLSHDLLKQAFNSDDCKDQKLSEIGLYLKGLLFPIHQKLATNEESKYAQQSATSKAEAAEKKKAIMNKKKAALMAKMKKKQTNFFTETPQVSVEQSQKLGVQSEAPSNSSVAQADEKLFVQTCASCQESLEVTQFFERPFTQLCYLSQTKMLYYTYRQTVESQKKSLKNLKDAYQEGGDVLDQNIPMTNQNPEVEERKGPVEPQSPSVTSNQSDALDEDPTQAWDSLVMNELQLQGVLDPSFKTGVSFTKCCHSFHFDCLQEYQTAEGQLNPQKMYIKEMVGYDDNSIQCPICKTFKNTWQPFLPLGLEADSDPEKTSQTRILPYIDFCSQLINNHLTSMPQSILAVDVKNDPKAFILGMSSTVTHMVLESTCLRNQKFLTPFDPQAQQDDVQLREIVYILMTTREIVKRLLFPGEDANDKLKELAASILEKIVPEQSAQNVFQKNFQMLVVKVLFICGICIGEDLSSVKKTVIESFYASFKAQVLLADVFKKQNGQIQRNQLLPQLLETLEQRSQEQQDVLSDSQVESQLTFLRAASAMAMSIDALILCQTTTLASYDSQQAMQLNLDQYLIGQLRDQVDDQSEFNLLTGYLNLDPSMNTESFFKSKQLNPLSVSQGNEFLLISLLAISRLDSDLSQQVFNLAMISQAMPNVQKEDNNSPMLEMGEELIEMPNNLHLLTTYFTFNLIDLPPDFNRLVKQYYTLQCRGCKKQLQESAICLLCGEIVCHGDTQKCCGNRKGMKPLFMIRDGGFNSMFGGAADVQYKPEGEMCYHARHCEGGNSIFLVPQSATIYMVDNGRIQRGESPYRNTLGEVFSQKSAKWDNYTLSEETGGAQVFANLRKNYLEHKLPQLILSSRQASERVIRRHAI